MDNLWIIYGYGSKLGYQMTHRNDHKKVGKPSSYWGLIILSHSLMPIWILHFCDSAFSSVKKNIPIDHYGNHFFTTWRFQIDDFRQVPLGKLQSLTLPVPDGPTRGHRAPLLYADGDKPGGDTKKGWFWMTW